MNQIVDDVEFEVAAPEPIIMDPVAKTATAVAPASRWNPPAPQALTPMDMVARAVAQGADITVLEKLMALQERWEANQARKAFDGAMADAKAKIPTITKNRRVHFASNKPGAASTDYRHEDLAAIVETITPILGEFGLSFRFRTTSEIGQPISVTCKISHREGHFEENTLIAGRDESGNKNSIQAIGSTVTYLQRYTLKAALGLAASNDDDGQASVDKPAEPTITEEQVMQLRDMLETEAGVKEFLGFAKLETLSDMFASKFDRAVRIIEQRAGQRK